MLIGLTKVTRLREIKLTVVNTPGWILINLEDFRLDFPKLHSFNVI